MKNSVLFFFLCAKFSLSAQIDFENPPWELGASEATTQTEMNLISYEEGMIADSIMNVLYDVLIKMANEDIQQQKMEKMDDTFRYQKRIKKAMVNSQKQFLKYRKLVLEVPNIAYEGGSMRSYAVNIAYKKVTVERIKLLQNYLEEYFER